MAYKLLPACSSAFLLWCTFAGGGSRFAALAQPFPFDATRTAEVKGVVTAVTISQQGDPPSLTLKTSAGREWKIRLGSMRYLIDNGFNPKIGQPASVVGFPVRDEKGGDSSELVAQQVSLTAIPQTLVFRDPDGRPKWRARGRRETAGGKNLN